MLQCFYARAMHSKNPKNKFHDAKAEELVEKIDYDFSNAKKDTAMSGGIVARSVVFVVFVVLLLRKRTIFRLREASISVIGCHKVMFEVKIGLSFLRRLMLNFCQK